jgi:hypothetical protein
MRAPKIAPLASGETEFKVERIVLAVAAGVVSLSVFFGWSMVNALLPHVLTNWVGEEAWRSRGLITALAAGGVLGCGGAAWRFNVIRWQAQLSWSLRGAAVGGAMVLASQVWPMLLIATVGSGVALGWLAVTLLSGLRPAVGTGSLGWVIGLGVAEACALVGVVELVGIDGRVQSIMATGLVAAASVLSPFLIPREPSISAERDYTMASLGRWLVVASGLVFLLTGIGQSGETDAASGAVVWIGVVVAVLAGWGAQRGVTMGTVLVAALVVGASGTFSAVGQQFAISGGLAALAVAGGYYAARGGRSWAVGILVGGSVPVVGGLSFLGWDAAGGISPAWTSTIVALVTVAAAWQMVAKWRLKL